MATNIRPLHDRVIVRRIEEGEQVRGGIIIPDSCEGKTPGRRSHRGRRRQI